MLCDLNLTCMVLHVASFQYHMKLHRNILLSSLGKGALRVSCTTAMQMCWGQLLRVWNAMLRWDGTSTLARYGLSVTLWSSVRVVTFLSALLLCSYV